MKKFALIFGVLSCVAVSPAFSTTMCVQDDNMAVILDPSVPGSGYTYDNALGRWDTTMPYGHIIGISACIGRSGSFGVARSQLTDSDTNGGNAIVGGEVTGKYCWCKMTHPAVSLWVFGYASSSASACASDCAYYCGDRVQYRSVFRAGLFGSVAN